MPEQDEIITLIDEEGNESDALIYDILELDGKKYAIVIPVIDEEDDEDEEAGAYVLRIDQDEDGDDILVEIEDEEWEKVKNACMEEFDFDVVE
ncbi:DUF1292 domain-containing protein [Desulfallas sp. Bu1-1]|uniref:DUF1292 domain-containing protein n=1 Tax=Desulfallas sp. Bu1-1 TaxID=2787620 RepID=UPI0018A04134|nr:DUF1292 domain-containing protein [Desulfallas sp. Bu1-1]MBF7082161.1 DUF1292 domain-containing protein [Desulfallas sp. Bu1-1]